ncbi:MAG: 23S rRNA (adenine(2503)-C(2))-methyltransferase RlmN [Spirochaetaceae bacterium]|jgi:23S rRNA (adenine2503-C2)-methyltransferase|nr:23S rRNA (adenine(2503)-C(2))-methyltransferase RlmN [Spirochaetaceae bacterium]
MPSALPRKTPEAKEKGFLAGYTLAELAELLSPLPRYRAGQIFSRISGGAASFGEMTELPKSLRQELGEKYSVYSSEISARLTDRDGTAKLQITLYDGGKIEAVLLGDGKDRNTACLSTQAGCPMGCVFCKTGALSFKRNLLSAEIVEQFLFLRKTAGKAGPGAGGISNIVIMGMGEPLLNLEELRRAIAVITAKEGSGLSPRRITVSTSGIAAGIRDLAEKGPPVRLALSLTTADSELRERLMPVTRTNPLKELKAALKEYQKTENRRITLEMVLLGGINTRQKDIEELGRFAEGLDVIVNLIPWNPVEGMFFEGRALREPESGELAAFTELLEKQGIAYTRRRRKGRGVGGACGQLGAAD